MNKFHYLQTGSYSCSQQSDDEDSLLFLSTADQNKLNSHESELLNFQHGNGGHPDLDIDVDPDFTSKASSVKRMNLDIHSKLKSARNLNERDITDFFEQSHDDIAESDDEDFEQEDEPFLTDAGIQEIENELWTQMRLQEICRVLFNVKTHWKKFSFAGFAFSSLFGNWNSWYLTLRLAICLISSAPFF